MSSADRTARDQYQREHARERGFEKFNVYKLIIIIM